MKARKNGGAVRPCAWTAVNPTRKSSAKVHEEGNMLCLLSFKMVGKNTGKLEKLTLQEKYISCVHCQL